MSNYATTDDVIATGRELTSEEITKADKLIPVVSALIRMQAKNQGKDFDAMILDNDDLAVIAKEVTVRAVLRALNASTTAEASTQITESAGGYSQTYSPLMPGGGVYIRRSEWKMLGLGRQLVRNVELI